MGLNETESWTVLAILLRPQGRKGEILAELHADPELLKPSSTVFLAAKGFAGPRSEARATELTAAWEPVGRNQGRIVLHFAGVESITEAERLSGLSVLIPKADRPQAEDGAEYVEDLVGCSVFDGETLVGQVDAVEFSTDPDGRRFTEVAPLLSVVTAEGHEILIPYVNDFLQSVDTQQREIRMRLPEGLLDLNLPAGS